MVADSPRIPHDNETIEAIVYKGKAAHEAWHEEDGQHRVETDEDGRHGGHEACAWGDADKSNDRARRCADSRGKPAEELHQ